MRLSRKFKDFVKFQAAYWPKEFICFLTGHRKLRIIKHSEICDRYWDEGHLKAEGDKLDGFCLFCDSGYLRQNPKGKWVDA